MDDRNLHVTREIKQVSEIGDASDWLVRNKERNDWLIE